MQRFQISNCSHSPARFAVMCVFSVSVSLFFGVLQADEPQVVRQSARELPISYEVDVLVVGGSTGAVAAASEAAEAGADVFLMAPYPYLGDDMAGALRLWLEPGETPIDPLAVELYNDPERDGAMDSPTNRLPFSYEADRESSPVHRDTNPPSKLTDGNCSSASAESVQFDGDVLLTADLGELTDLAELRLLSFYRENAPEREQNFKVAAIAIATSVDGENWTVQGVAERPEGTVATDAVMTIRLEFMATARYVRIEVKKADDVDRILLGELLILPQDEEVEPAPGEETPPLPAPRPLHVKRVLDDALINAGVDFLFSTYPTNVEIVKMTAQGFPTLYAVTMANRAGRQVVLTKTIVDATPNAAVARMGRIPFQTVSDGPQPVSFVIIGGEPQEIEGGTFEVKGSFSGPWPNPAGTASGEFPIINYTIEENLTNASSWGDWCAVENVIRNRAFHQDQQFTADALFQIPNDVLTAAVPDNDPQWNGVDALPLGAFTTSNEKVYVLNGCAAISREKAEKLLRPLALIDMGRRIGAVVANASDIDVDYDPSDFHSLAYTQPRSDLVSGEVHETLAGARPTHEGELPLMSRGGKKLPVLGDYDVVVVGGGTTGAPAGISAARQGAKTLVVEYLHTMGGVGTTGAISNYYWGNKVGFTSTVPGGTRWNIEQKMNFWRSELIAAGGDVWFGCLGCGALVEHGTVKGVIVTTPQGRGVVLADVVIDATGNADIAFPAGAACIYTDASELAVQGTGLGPRALGAAYANTDFTLVDETDAVDVWHVFVYAKDKYPGVFDQQKLIDTRERRRIVGEFEISLLDQLNGRTHPDTISQAYSNFDTHGYTVDPFIELEHPEKAGHYVSVPYRCTLPVDLEGILVGGLGISVHRDALPLVRMQADMQNLGYALGWAAANASREGISVRDVDVKELQRHLVDIGNLTENVLTDLDSYGVTDEELAAAVADLPNHFAGVQIVMWAPRERAQAAVRSAFLAADESDLEARNAYAQTLAVMGDPIGIDLLIDQVEAYEEWDAGWNYRGMGQFGSALSPLDRLIIALGRAGDTRAVPTILDKLEILTPEHDFSHHRACGMALEMLRDRTAAPALAEHLMKPGMSGFAHDTLGKARELAAASPEGTNATQTRRDSLCELATARALYRCGDYNGLGEAVLGQYVEDLRGHFARHAKAVLEEGANPREPESTSGIR
jgi:hypothetical protein